MEHLGLPIWNAGWWGISCSLPFPPLLQQHLILVLNFCALRPGCQGGQWKVRGGAHDHHQCWGGKSQVFIRTFLLPCLSSEESESPGQMVINFHSSFQGGWGAACQRPEGHVPNTPPSTFPTHSQLLLVPKVTMPGDGMPRWRLFPRTSLLRSSRDS